MFATLRDAMSEAHHLHFVHSGSWTCAVVHPFRAIGAHKAATALLASMVATAPRRATDTRWRHLTRMEVRGGRDGDADASPLERLDTRTLIGESRSSLSIMTGGNLSLLESLEACRARSLEHESPHA